MELHEKCIAPADNERWNNLNDDDKESLSLRLVALKVPDVTEQNWFEAFTRSTLFDSVTGLMPTFATEDFKATIGMKFTGVETITAKEFDQLMMDIMREQIARQA